MELSLGCRREPPGPSVSELVKVADDQGSEAAGHLMSGNSGSYRTARFGTWVETERVLSGRARKQRTECEGRFVPPVASSVLDVAKPKRVTAAFVPVVVGRYPQIDCAEASIYDRIFLLSQSFIPAVNTLLIGSLLYQSRLVPRWLPLVGFTGATLLVGSDVAVLFGLIGQHGATGVFAIPIAVWEFSLGVCLVVKGFRPSAIAALYGRPVAVAERSRQ